MRRAGRKRGVTRVLPGLMLAMLMGALDQTIMAPALPAVAGELGRLDRMADLVTAYLTAATVVMPVYGKLGDRFGRKRMLMAAVVLFVAGAVLCATAESFTALIAFRALQGLGGGGLMIGPQAIIGEIVSPRERGRYLGLLGGVFVLAAVAGPVLGGLLIDRVSWRWIFSIHVPLGLVALAVLARTLRLPRPAGGARIDHLGGGSLAVAVIGVVALTGGLGGNGVPGASLAWAGVTAAGVAGWLLAARFAADPIIPLGLFRDRAFAVPAAISFLIGFAMFGTVSYAPSLLQIALGASASQSGLALMALMAGIIVATVVSGRMITRTGRYRLYPVAGTALAGTGMALLAVTGTAGGVRAVVAAMVLLGVGIGLVMQVMVLVAQNAVEHRHLGVATGTVTFLRQIGASTGVAVAGSLISARFLDALPASVAARLGDGAGALTPGLPATLTPSARAAVAEAFGQAVPAAFILMTPLLALAFGLALLLPARPLRDTAHVTMATTGPIPEESRS